MSASGDEYDVLFVLPMPTTKIVGGYKMVYEYANYLSRKGKKVCIVYNGYRGENSKNLPKLPIYCTRVLIGKFGPKWFSLDKKVSRKVIKNFDEKRIPHSKIIVATTAESAVFVNALKYKYQKKIYFIQGFENWTLTTDELYETYRYNMIKVVVSKWLYDEVKKHCQDDLYYIPNGIDHKVFSINIDRKKRKKHTIAVLYHYDEQKGCDVSLNVIKQIKKQYHDLDVYAFGSPKRPNEWEDWIHYSHNASPEIVSECMNQSSIFLCTSRQEGYGLTGLESIFCGCILVTTDTKGVHEYATQSNSCICSIDDESALVDAVCKVFDNDDFAEELFLNCDDIRNSYDVEVSKKKFFELAFKNT